MHHPPLPRLAHISRHRTLQHLRRTIPPPSLDANPPFPSNTSRGLLRRARGDTGVNNENLQRDGHHRIEEHRRDEGKSRSLRGKVLRVVLRGGQAMEGSTRTHTLHSIGLGNVTPTRTSMERRLSFASFTIKRTTCETTNSSLPLSPRKLSHSPPLFPLQLSSHLRRW